MNMQALLKQAQNMQKDMLRAKSEIDSMDFIGENGAVKITLKGTKNVVKVDIDKDFDFEDIDMLQDMIMIAMNDALSKIDKITEEKMGKYTNSMPGLF